MSTPARKLNVLQVCDHLGWEGSRMHGVKRLFAWMIPRFDPARYNVSLVSLRRKDLSEETLDSYGIDITYLHKSRFDPATLQCGGAKDATCLEAGQVSALRRAFGGPRTSSGRVLYVGQAWDPGIAAPGWRQWKLGSSQTGTPNAANTTLMAGALAHEFFTPPDPAFGITQFDFDRDPARMEAFSAIFDTYRDASLAEFRKRGGKLLIFHGTADPIFSALESIDYYQRLTHDNGGSESTGRWARLFLVPGMNHCAGGPATDQFDALTPLVNWVEKGEAPDALPASARGAGNAGGANGDVPASWAAARTRPLCAYPKVATYNGSGDVEQAASFTCR